MTLGANFSEGFAADLDLFLQNFSIFLSRHIHMLLPPMHITHPVLCFPYGYAVFPAMIQA